jgi:hypothetical protein
MPVNWKNRYETAERARKFAWAKFFESEREQHEAIQGQYQRLSSVLAPEGIPIFVQNELKEMMEELRKKIDCPVCLNEIAPSDIAFSKCGHKFCADCLNRCKENEPPNCAVCRRKL